ncbi:glucose 1-dehydrogenase 3 [Elysia marginata]|uniref:Glucose 1-dehydrogenase 3 n=1 Tax=Elysia marginata TaxID=1093978 RepID=A0AAV4JUP0_9GAST|nr:glucose 1-dehydrogenase 3 [Elysia marginata]
MASGDFSKSLLDENDSDSRAITPNLSRFSGKVAIVTGSSSGLGEVVALRLAREGACVTLTGRDKTRLAAMVSRCQAAARDGEESGDTKQEADVTERFLAVVGNLTAAETRKRIVSQTIATFGRLDVLVSNAGIFTTHNDLSEVSEENFDEMIATNVKTCFFMVQLAAPHLEQTKGNVVIVSSTLSVMNWPAAVLYSLSKAALDKLTFTFALTLAPKGVRVNGVNPSFIPTRVIREWAKSEEAERETAHGFAAAIGPLHPLHGRCATADEFADTVLFAASDEARYVTGQRIVCDAGAHLVGAFSALSAGSE